MEETSSQPITNADLSIETGTVEMPEKVDISQASLSKTSSTITSILSENADHNLSDKISSDERSTKSNSSGNASVANTSVSSISSRLSARFIKIRESESNVKTISKNPLEDMSDTTLLNTLETLKQNTKCLQMENTVFTHFLDKNDPSKLQDLDTSVAQAQMKSQRTSVTATRKLTLTRYSRRESTLLWNPPSLSTILSSDTPLSLEREGPKINLTQKTDLVLREMDEIQTTANAIAKKIYVARHKLNAQLEEMAIRESELRSTLETFENVFINCTVEKYTQSTNPAEKFSRFLEEWFKNSCLTIDKIRLRTSSLRVQYQKICHQLNQKQLLGENLQEVDFEQLHIENKNLRINIEQRNLLLLELKKMHGKANLLLSQLKKQLLKKSSDLENIQKEIKDKEQKIIKFDEECEKVSEELDDMKAEHDKIKMKSETYQVPQILDYVKTKADVDILRKNLKIWLRRKQLKEVSLNAIIREMKAVTGMKKVQPHWFIDPILFQGGRSSLESTFQFDFERQRKIRVSEKSKRKFRSKY